MASLKIVGKTTQGHYLLRAESSSQEGKAYNVYVSQDGARVSCDCLACSTHPKRTNGRLTVTRADVLANRVPRVCWHLRHAARWAPLRVRA